MGIKRVLNNWVRKSPWYTEGDLKDCQKFWDGIPYNLQVVNLGSNSAKFAFDYSEMNVNAANLAMGPQCLLMDMNILKTYKEHLNKGAVVFIPMCPFSSMAGYNYLIDPKYHTFLPKENIPNYSKKTEAKMLNLKNDPLRTYPLMRLFVDIKNSVLGIFKKNGEGKVDFEASAQGWIKSWMNEFDIQSFDDELSLENAKNKRDSASIIKSIVDYCIENKFRPYVVMPPISKTLTSKMSSSMRNTFIFDYLRIAEIPDSIFLNYLDDEALTSNTDYFQNAYFMNKKGALAFTKKIIESVNI